MIVAPKFPGDDDHLTMSAQHDCYSQALAIMVHGCLNHIIRAYHLLGQAVPAAVDDRLRDGFDHRTVQNAHDHLAAYWRAASRRTTPSLLLAEEAATTTEWLRWLRSEIEGWVATDHTLIRLVVAAVAEQNTELGYESEAALSTGLAARYPLPSSIRPDERVPTHAN